MHNPIEDWDRGLSPKTIDNFRQNTPELIVEDAKHKLKLSESQCDILRDILLARGVNKWLKARMDIITMKHQVRGRLKAILSNYNKKRDKQAVKILQMVLGDLRKICHQPRWVIWPRYHRTRHCRGKFQTFTSKQYRSQGGM